MRHSCVIDCEGNLYSCGINQYGQLGLDNPISRNRLTHVSTEPRVSDVACGYNHTLIATEEGDLYHCGSNSDDEFRLDMNDAHITHPLALIPYDYKISQVACNYNHSVILDNQGGIHGYGSNSNGELGLEVRGVYDTYPLTHIPTDYIVTQVACGSDHTVTLDSDGNVHACGLNNYGQLGLGDTMSMHRLTLIPTDYRIIQVACGENYTIVLSEIGVVYSSGLNGYGQLGLGDTSVRHSLTPITTDYLVTQVACGDSHTIVLDSEGSIHACGLNVDGQLGLGDTSGRSQLTDIHTDYIITQVACGNNHTMVLDSESKMYACGYNNYGQLGLGDTTSRSSLTQVPIDTLSGVAKLMNTPPPKKPQIKSAMSCVN